MNETKAKRKPRLKFLPPGWEEFSELCDTPTDSEEWKPRLLTLLRIMLLQSEEALKLAKKAEG